MGDYLLHVAVGNMNLDLYIVVDKLPDIDGALRAKKMYMGLGGAASNYAVAVARIEHRVKLVVHTGELVEFMGLLSRLRDEGIELDRIKIHRGELPGIVVVFLLPGGHRAMVSIPGANRFLTGEEVENTSTDILHLASVSTSVLEKASSSSKASVVSYDPGGAIASSEGGLVVVSARNFCDILSLNRVEFRYVAGREASIDAAKSLLGGRLSRLLVKLGSEGAILVTRDRAYRVEAYSTGRVVDTTGAGDVFDAVFNSYLFEEEDIEYALQAASIAAGIKVSRPGAQSAPMRREVEKILGERPPAVYKYSV